MNRAQRNNNPVNLRAYKPVGECTEVKDGFAYFPSPFAGWRAAHRQIHTDQDRDLTIREFINKFAPPNENNTSQYLEFVCKEMCVGPEEKLRSVSKYALAGVMAAEEGYYNTEA